MPTLAIIGAGAWGSALAVHLSAQASVRLFARDPSERQALARLRENRRYLASVALPASIALPDTVEDTLAHADLVLIATPTAALLEVLRSIAPDRSLLWLCKGFATGADGVPQLPHELIAASDHRGGYGVLSGPSFALEVARRLPTALTLASPDPAFAQHWATQLRDATLRIYSSDDVIGVELGGAVKNVLAIAAGICDGLGFGANARAALITRGIAEMGRLSEALGGRRDTLMGLSGLGDLVLTCTGELSRNRRVGLELASGLSLAEILASLGHVAEGVPTASAVHAVARAHGVDMPICAAVQAVLNEGLDPRVAVMQLLQREPGTEL